MTFPEDGIFIAILTNSAIAGRDPEPRAVKIAWLALGLTEPERKTVTLAASDLDKVAGVYVNDRKQEYYFSREGAKLFAQRQGGSKNEIYPPRRRNSSSRTIRPGSRSSRTPRAG